MKKVPIAVEEFKKIIEENYYYIDKTKFIEDVLNDGAEVSYFAVLEDLERHLICLRLNISLI